MQKPYSKDHNAERSLRRAVREGGAYSVMAGAGETYFSAYALLLKASTTQIAFLASVPSLLGSFMQLVSAWIGHGSTQRKPFVIAGELIQALMWLPMIWLPHFFPDRGMTIFIACAVVYYAAANFASPGWNSWLGDLVPAGERGRYFGNRSRYMNMANFCALAGAGLILHYGQLHASARAGFSVVFTVAMFARLFGAYQVYRMWEPQAVHHDEQARTLRGMLYSMRQSHFMRFSLFQAAMNLSAGIAGPFFAVYMLRDLHFSYLQFMTSTAIVVLAQFVTLNMWGRLGDKFGNRVILAATSVIVSILPVLWLFSTNFWFIVAIQVLGGLSWAGFNLSASNFVYDCVTPARRSVYGAVHNTLGAIAMFIGAAIGGYLGAHLPASANVAGMHFEFASALCWLFLLSTIARFIAAAWFVPNIKEVREVQHITTRQLLWRICGMEVVASVVLNRGRGKL